MRLILSTFKTYLNKFNLSFVFIFISIVVYLIFLKIQFHQSNKTFAEEFKKQNLMELNRGDVLSLTTRLNSLSSTIPWQCIKAIRGETTFFERKKSKTSCKTTLFNEEIIIQESNASDINIVFVLSARQQLQSTAIPFIILQLLLLCLLAWSSKREEKLRAKKQLEIINSAINCLVNDNDLDLPLKQNCPEILASWSKLKAKLSQFKNEITTSSKLKALGELSGMLAHDIKKPFSKMNAFLTLLENEKNNSLIQETIPKLKHSIAFANSMIIDYLSFSEKSDIKRELLSVKRLLLDALSMLPKSNQLKDHIKIQCADDITIKGDYLKLLRVIQNILANAIEAKQDNDHKILINVQTIVTSKENNIKISILNNGPKLDKAAFESIFKPFITKNKPNGTGLGLTICKKIVDLHNGEISAKNRDDGFVEFSIVLPTEIHSNKKLKKEITINYSNKEFMRRKKTILYVDDDSLMQRLLEKNISSFNSNYSVHCFKDAESLLKDFSSFSHIDFILSDENLGDGMSGRTLLKKLCPHLPKTKFAILSNYPESTFKEKALQAGADKYFEQPVKSSDLQTWLEM